MSAVAWLCHQEVPETAHAVYVLGGLASREFTAVHPEAARTPRSEAAPETAGLYSAREEEDAGPELYRIFTTSAIHSISIC